MAKTLQLQFETDNGKLLMVTVDNPKETLTETEIQAGMAAIIASNVFHIGGKPLSAVKSAKVVERNVSQII
ncbi:DUF2922 domain-containing protein [Psychrobacillus sp. FJAT-51614]|uniref:DUF2922 domain-containing protein n=1 Tax=Psychrobacillus mangrovi TaxID=3117745 RepID=A0ABU8EZA4_9BACI